MFDSEEGFQAVLDADPTDWITRGVFADWLEERGDPRAAGYRELSRLKKRPHMGGRCPWFERLDGTTLTEHEYTLPVAWFDRIDSIYRIYGFFPCHHPSTLSDADFRAISGRTRRWVEDRVARAFTA